MKGEEDAYIALTSHGRTRDDVRIQEFDEAADVDEDRVILFWVALARIVLGGVRACLKIMSTRKISHSRRETYAF